MITTSDKLVSELERWTLPQHRLLSPLELYLGMRKPNWQSSSNQSGLMTQIRTRPIATQQGRIKCRHHITVPTVPTQEAQFRRKAEKNEIQNKIVNLSHSIFNGNKIGITKLQWAFSSASQPCKVDKKFRQTHFV